MHRNGPLRFKVKVKLSLCLTNPHAIKNYLRLIKLHAVKTYWGMNVKLHALLTSALDGDEWSA